MLGVDPIIVLGMIFSLIVLLIIGGVLLTFPVVRRLGPLMEEWIEVRKAERLEGPDFSDVRGTLGEIRGRLEAVESRLDALGERQDFTESLLESGESETAGGGDR